MVVEQVQCMAQTALVFVPHCLIPIRKSHVTETIWRNEIMICDTLEKRVTAFILKYSRSLPRVYSKGFLNLSPSGDLFCNPPEIPSQKLIGCFLFVSLSAWNSSFPLIPHMFWENMKIPWQLTAAHIDLLLIITKFNHLKLAQSCKISSGPTCTGVALTALTTVSTSARPTASLLAMMCTCWDFLWSFSLYSLLLWTVAAADCRVLSRHQAAMLLKPCGFMAAMEVTAHKECGQANQLIMGLGPAGFLDIAHFINIQSMHMINQTLLNITYVGRTFVARHTRNAWKRSKRFKLFTPEPTQDLTCITVRRWFAEVVDCLACIKNRKCYF